MYDGHCVVDGVERLQLVASCALWNLATIWSSVFFSLRLIVHVNESSITTDAGSCYFLFTYLVWYSSTSFSATYLDLKKRMMCSLSLTMITEGNNDILQFYSGIVTNIFLTFRL